VSELTKQLEELLRGLKLKAILALYREITEQASARNLQYEEYLILLLEEELKRREEASVRAKVSKAKFPFIKTIEGFDFSFQPGLREKELIKLASLDFIEKKENIVFLGPPGVGKTHLSIGLGVKACIARYRVLFSAAQKLIEELSIAERDGSIMEKLLAYSRLHLLVIDELGYMPISRQQANLLFRLISIRYERGSTILTSNYAFEEWGRIFDDQVVAAAIIDRLVHHAHIFPINGSSWRIKDKLNKGGHSSTQPSWKPTQPSPELPVTEGVNFICKKGVKSVDNQQANNPERKN
jgi:DNA replication protein DnaC